MTGLTPFILNMIAAPRDRLAGADPAKLAVKYNLREDWCAWYLQQWRAVA